VGHEPVTWLRIVITVRDGARAIRRSARPWPSTVGLRSCSRSSRSVHGSGSGRRSTRRFV